MGRTHPCNFASFRREAGRRAPPRVFIGNGLADEFSRRARRPTRVLTYLANSLSTGEHTTPYSFVTGTDAPWLPKALTDDGIVLNQWLADDLQAKVGDTIKVRYYALGAMRTLVEKEANLEVQDVVPLSGPFADPSLMPDFPGIADSEDCTDWDTGIRLDFSSIRLKDEDYWDKHRGTPKAFVTLARAQELWGNRFGSLTSVRFRDRDRELVASALATAAKPSSLGLLPRAVWEDGRMASRNAVDFSGLFLGLSFFLIAAALLLTALLYSLALEQRKEQVITLRSLGWTARQVQRLFLRESLYVAIPGAVLGGLGGVFYNGLVIRALTSIWSGSVGNAPLQPFVSWGALLCGVPVTVLVAHLSLRIPLKRTTRGAPREGIGWTASRRPPRKRVWLAALLVASGVAIVLLTPPGRGKDASASFFGAGTLLLAGLLIGSQTRRCRAATHSLGRMKMICRGTNRSPGRALAVEGILACAVFLTVAVGANRHGSHHRADRRDSGTGGFIFFGETSIPVFEDLNSLAGKERYGLVEPGMDPIDFVQFSLLPGDEASCLNLNQPQRPRLLGVDPEELDSRQAFRFTSMVPEVNPDHPWLALDEVWDDATVPAIADATVITWALQRRVGETFTIRAEDGRVVRLRLVAALANSVLQGNLVLGRKALQSLYPSVSGSRVLLIDTSTSGRVKAGEVLRQAFRDFGLELTPLRHASGPLLHRREHVSGHLPGAWRPGPHPRWRGAGHHAGPQRDGPAGRAGPSASGGIQPPQVGPAAVRRACLALRARHADGHGCRIDSGPSGDHDRRQQSGLRRAGHGPACRSRQRHVLDSDRIGTCLAHTLDPGAAQRVARPKTSEPTEIHGEKTCEPSPHE